MSKTTRRTNEEFIEKLLKDNRISIDRYNDIKDRLKNIKQESNTF